MNILTLTALLQDAVDEIGEDAAENVEVRLAHQPRWAFEYSINDVQMVSNPEDEGEECPDCEGEGCSKCVDGMVYKPDDSLESEHVIYLVEGNQLGYLPEKASRELGWSHE